MNETNKNKPLGIIMIALGLLCLIAVHEGIISVLIGIGCIIAGILFLSGKFPKVKPKADLEAEVKAKREYEKEHSFYEVFNVKGVTFDNEDGENRQAILKKLSKEDCYNEVEFIHYEYKGKPALYVSVMGKIVGNVPADRVTDIIGYEARYKRIHDDAEIGIVDEDDENFEGKDKIYYCEISVKYEKI